MKTAVEFYREHLHALVSGKTEYKTESEIFEKAKEIEEEIIKKEREEAYKNGYENGQMDAFTK